MVRIIKGKSALLFVVAGGKATTGFKAFTELEPDGISPTYDGRFDRVVLVCAMYFPRLGVRLVTLIPDPGAIGFKGGILLFKINQKRPSDDGSRHALLQMRFHD